MYRGVRVSSCCRGLGLRSCAAYEEQTHRPRAPSRSQGPEGRSTRGCLWGVNVVARAGAAGLACEGAAGL